MAAAPASPISPEQAAWICGSVSIIVASRDARLHPHLVRAIGCRLSDDRCRVTLLLPGRSAHQVLEDLRDIPTVAAVFTEPSTNRSLQLKGRDTTLERVGDAADLRLAERYRLGFIEELGRLGFGPQVGHGILAHEDDLFAIGFMIEAAFDQTPGPAAGRPLAAAD